MKLFGFNITRQKLSEQPTQLIEKVSDNVTVVNSFSFASDNKYLPSDYSTRYNAGGYIRFGDDNLFPNKLIELYNSSPLHKSAIDFKTRLIFGDGYELTTEANKLKTEIFLNNLDGSNNLNFLLEGIITDLKLFGNYYLLVTWNENFTKIIKIERLKAFGVRLMADIDGNINSAVYNNDWQFRPGVYKQYPLFNVMDKMNKQQVFIGVKNKIDSNIYTYPDYVSALNSIAANAAIGLYQINIVENGFSPSMSIKFFKKPNSPEEKTKIVNDIKKQYAGKRNAGKALIFFSDGKDLAPEVAPIDISNLDKQYTVLEDSILNAIVQGHGIISPTLLGLKTAGQLGNVQELKNAYMISNVMKTEMERKNTEDSINKFLMLNGLDTIKIKPLEVFPEEQEKQI
jgi:hypothetical protein